jgi:hypothetical protein
MNLHFDRYSMSDSRSHPQRKGPDDANEFLAEMKKQKR